MNGIEEAKSYMSTVKYLDGRQDQSCQGDMESL